MGYDHTVKPVNGKRSGMEMAVLVSRKMLLDGPKHFVHERLRMPDDAEVDWYYVDTPDSVMIIPITDSGKLVFVRQYRYNLRSYTLELPAGLVGDDEDAGGAVVRELGEETGYALADGASTAALGRYYLLPSETNKYVNIYLAAPVTRVGEAEGDKEIEQYFGLGVVEISVKEALESIGSTIVGLETVAALMLARQHLPEVGRGLGVIL